MQTPSDKAPGLTFPCVIDVKIFINNDQQILAVLKTFTKSHLGENELKAWRCRESSGGKYLAISATVASANRAHIDAYYQALHDHPDVIMTI